MIVKYEIRKDLFQEWLESRQNQSSSAQHLKVVHPYDWTFTTDYAGTITHQADYSLTRPFN